VRPAAYCGFRMRGRSEGRRRHSADERRVLVLEAARAEFAAVGLGAATGESISYRAGISHPYLLRLFGSKRELFLAVVEATFDELLDAVGEAAGSSDGSQALAAAETAIATALENRGGAALLLQFLAACGEDDIRPPVRRRLAELYRALVRVSGGEEPEVAQLFARLVLRGATEAMRLPEVAGRDAWARRLLTLATTP
jgi:AcrR family transcriptional regulator